MRRQQPCLQRCWLLLPDRAQSWSERSWVPADVLHHRRTTRVFLEPVIHEPRLTETHWIVLTDDPCKQMWNLWSPAVSRKLSEMRG